VVLVEVPLPDALGTCCLWWANVRFGDLGPLRSPGLRLCGRDRSACTLSCVGCDSVPGLVSPRRDCRRYVMPQLRNGISDKSRSMQSG